MASDPVSFDGLRGLNGVLTRLPQGAQVQALAEKLGLWSTSAHTSLDSRKKAFPTNFSRLSDAQLSDEEAYWVSEVGRATELVGLFEGQKILLAATAKAVRASARGRVRRNLREQQAVALTAAAAGADGDAAKAARVAKVKDPTLAELSDALEEEMDVQNADAALTFLLVVLESAKAYKEACLAGAAGLSREISFRQAQMGARLR